jgi:hypothetical protein
MFGRLLASIVVGVALIVGGVLPARADAVTDLLLLSQNPHKKPPPYVPGFALGINLSGLENPFPSLTTGAEVSYYVARGFTKFRLPTSWSKPNVQCVSGISGYQFVTFGPLDTTSTCYGGNTGYIGLIDSQIATIAAAGGSTLLDVHMFGVGPGGFNIGTPQVPVTAFADLWTKLSTHYKGMAGIRGYDLMNEWINGFDSSIVFSANQAAINAIRANGDTTPIYIEGTNYSGAWNWVTGQGQPFNNSNMYKLVDPLNKLVFMAHGYLDNDSSGINFSWAIETAKPGAAPPGTPTSATIGVTRDTPVLVWARQHGVQLSHGETGGSNDALAAGGNDNYAAWNTALSNEIAFAKANNYEIDIFSGGPGFNPGYPPFIGPSSVSNPTLADFTSAGLQSTMMVMLEQYSGYSGPQPIAYRVDLPVTITPSGNPEVPSIAINNYGSAGVTTGNFTIRYNGKIASPVVITPHDYLADGVTPAGGTFTPSTVTLAPTTNNVIANFTYTPSQNATIVVTTTNNAGWIDPPTLGLGFSSINDVYHANGIAIPTNIYGLYRRYTPYLGPALTLKRTSDGATLSFSFNNIGNLPRTAIQAWAGSTVIPVTTVFDQSPNGNNLTFTGTLCSLHLNNGLGYPDIECPSGTTGAFNTPVSGQNATTFIARMDQTASTGGMFRQDQFLGPLVLSASTFEIVNTGYVAGVIVWPGAATIGNVALGIITNAYHEYAGTYTSGVTNGIKTYLDGTLNAQATPAQSITASFTCTQSGTNVTVSGILGSINLANTTTLGGTGVASGTTILSQTSGPTGGAGVYVTNISGTASGTTCSASQVPYTLNAAFSSQSTQFGYFRFGTSPWVGNWYNLEFEQGQTLTAGQIGAVNTSDNNYYSTPLPDTLPPAIGGTGTSTVVASNTSKPFVGVTIGDANAGSPTDSLVITLTGSAGGTLTGTGLSGSGPYTMAAASAATITTQLRALVYTPAGGVSTTETMTIAVTSSAGTNASDSNTVVTVTVPSSPVIAGAAPTVTIVGKPSMPFFHQYIGNGVPFQTAVMVVTDPNSGATDSATITLTGSAGGTMTGTGLSGTGPYTLAFATPAALTTELQALVYNPGSATATQTETLTVQINSSAGSTASNSVSVVTVNAVAPPETPYPAPSGTFTPVNFSGVNISAAENKWPSSSRFNYIYPEFPNLSYWAGKGFGIIRMPTTQPRLQPDTYGPLDPPAYVRNSTNCPYFTASQDGFVGRCDEQAQASVATVGAQTNLTAIKAVLDQAFALNMYVILDIHDFGEVQNSLMSFQPVYPGSTNPALNGTEGTAELVDLWTRLATKFKNYPNVIFDVMNEPNAQTAAEWFTAQTAVNNAIAAVTTSHIVMIEGTCFSGAHDWVACGNSTVWAGYVPPAGLQVVYEMHEYLDHDFSGTPSNPCVNGSAPMAGATSWGVTNGVKIFIGESAWDQDSTCMTLGSQLFSYMKTNDIANGGPYWGFTYWVGGDSAFFNAWNNPSLNYGFSVVPAGLPSGPFTDAPQTTILTTNILH